MHLRYLLCEYISQDIVFVVLGVIIKALCLECFSYESASELTNIAPSLHHHPPFFDAAAAALLLYNYLPSIFSTTLDPMNKY